MFKCTICIGSSCHLKGSRQIVETFQDLVSKNNLSDDVELSGTFCLGHCRDGVSVKIDDELFSLTPDTSIEFFNENVIKKIPARN